MNWLFPAVTVMLASLFPDVAEREAVESVTVPAGKGIVCPKRV